MDPAPVKLTMTPQLKQPGERLTLRFDMPEAGASISSIVSAEITAAGRVPAVDALEIAAQIYGASYAMVSVEGGTLGELYLVEVMVETERGDRLQRRQELLCLDLSFRMPSISPPAYLTIEQFVLRAGLDATISLTDENGSGAVDAARLEAALLDAQAFVDSYLAARYAVPLASPIPSIVVTATYDIALARLYRDALPDNVVARQTAAMRLLADLRSGTATLPVETPPAEKPAGIVMFRQAERRFSRESLGGY